MAMKLFEAFVEIKGKLAPLKKSLDMAKAAVSKAIGAMNRMFAKLVSISKKAFLGVAAALGVSLKAFASFETQLANVATMLSEQTMHLLPRFGKELQRLAVLFGESTETLAEGLYNILSASIAPSKAMKVLETATKAAAAGITDTSTAAYAITGILNAYSMSADKAAAVSDILFATVNRGQTTFAKLASGIGRVTSLAASAGIPLEEVAAALATITRGGVSTEEAVTSLRAMLDALQGKAKEGIDIAKSLGVELSVEALKRNKLTGTLKQLSSLSATNIKDIFREMTARMGLNILLDQQEGYLKDLSITMDAAGMTSIAYEQHANTLTRIFKSLWQAIKQTGVTIGTAFSEQTKKTIQDITNAIVKAQPVIAVWAEKIASTMIYVKDILKTFVSWLSTDWTTNIRTALEATIPLWKALGDSIVLIMKTAGTKSYESFTNAFGKKIGKWLIELGRPEGPLGVLSMMMPGPASLRLRTIEAGIGMVKGARKPSTTNSWKDVMKTITADFKKASDKAFGLLPDVLKTSFEKDTAKWRTALKSIVEKAAAAEGVVVGGAAGGAAAAAAGGAAAAGKRKIGFAGIKEAWKRISVGLVSDQTSPIAIQKRTYEEIRKGNKHSRIIEQNTAKMEALLRKIYTTGHKSETVGR